MCLTLFCLALGLAVVAAPARAQWALTPINFPSNYSPPLCLYPAAYGVNDTGDVVGDFDACYTDASGNVVDNAQGFLWTGGSNFVTEDILGASSTYPGGISDSGIVSGAWYDSSGNEHGFVGLPGQFSTFDFPGASCGGTQPQAMSGSGQFITGIWFDSNCNTRGFIWNQGSLTTLDYPGAVWTYPSGVNDSGQVVGSAQMAGGAVFGFVYSGGKFSGVTLPGAGQVWLDGIDDAGDTVGYQVSQSNGNYQGFILSGGKLVPFPGRTGPGSWSELYGISASGNYVIGFDAEGWFIAAKTPLLDPVPDLMNGPAVATDSELQAIPSGAQQSVGLGGRPVAAVAADGVTEVVIRIPAANAGDVFTFTLYNDQNSVSTDADQDGALGNPGDTTFTANTVTVSAINLTGQDGSQHPYAFAVYRAPVDFARQGQFGGGLDSNGYYLANCPNGNPTSGGDDQLQCRQVFLQIQGNDGTTSNFPITILRPPVELVHGLWSGPGAWDNFKPLVDSPLFYMERAEYDWDLSGQLYQTSPAYSSLITSIAPIRASSLGFAFNAQSSLLPQTIAELFDFRQGQNPLQIPAAATQVDIVAHSMGGDVARAMAADPGFLANDNLGQGYIHKMITIGTPHLGSPLANDLLTSQEEGGCVETALAAVGDYVLDNVRSVVIGDQNGAMADLEVGSNELSVLGLLNLHQIPTAYIAGDDPNFSAPISLPVVGSVPSLLYGACAVLPPLAGKLPDPIATYLDSAQHWNALFNNGEFNDGVVSRDSALNGLTPPAGTVFSGFAHSAAILGFWNLGFAPPSLLDAESSEDNIPVWVIHLMNTPVTDSSLFHPLSP